MALKSAHLLVLAVIFLVALGVVMLLSTTAFSRDDGGEAFDMVRKQFQWLGLGLLGCALVASLDYHWLERAAVVVFVVSAVLLVLCFVHPIGRTLNGASRWISGDFAGLGFLRLQPSEIAKLAAIIFLARWYARNEGHSGEFNRGFVQPLCAVGLLILLIAAEVDLGSAALLTGVTLVVMFVAGASMVGVGGVAVAGVAGLASAVVMMPERLARVAAFLDLEKHRAAEGFQQWHALVAFGYGGVGGAGLGNGRQKLHYLPEAHTDFIFAMVGEELGLVFTLLVVAAFVAILLSGGAIALHAPDRFGRLLAFGIIAAITMQAVINVGVTTAVLPNKGMPLPFVSYGGSNLVYCFLGVGILLNIYRQGRHMRDDRFPKILRAKVTPRL